MDVYYPVNAPADGKTPILFFIYGGGFTAGDRILPPPFSLGYACVGAYFAQRGFITIIPDYRLVPHVRFPSPAEDVRDAMSWVVKHPQILISRYVPEPDVDSLFLMGHSSGAVHAATALFHPELLESTNLQPRIKGVILCSGGYHFQPVGIKTDYGELMGKYWGGVEETKKQDPLGLFNSASDEKIAGLPDVLLVEAERDSDWMKVVGKDFYQALQARRGVRVKKIFGKGHNHISLNWALGTGQGEEWAEEMIGWMQSILSRPGAASVEDVPNAT